MCLKKTFLFIIVTIINFPIYGYYHYGPVPSQASYVYCNANLGISNFLPSMYHSYIFNPSQLMAPSPQAYNFSLYGNVNIDKYNGLLDFDIDINKYSDRDFLIPITFKYISNGFKPSVRPSVLGNNWMINCGGVITRKVVGRPDDTKGIFKPEYNTYCNSGLFTEKESSTFHTYSNSDLWNLNIKSNVHFDIDPFHSKDYFDYDLEPDIFKFTFPGCSGSFFINSSGEAELLDNKNCKILLDQLAIQENNYSSIPSPSKIKIISDLGFIYTFGGDTSCLEYIHAIPNNHIALPPKHITAWYLSSITAPNGRTALFKYHNQLQKNKYHYLGHTIAMSDFEVIPNIDYEYLGYDDFTFEDYYDVYQSIYDYNTFGEFSVIKDSMILEEQIHTPLLDKVIVGDNIINFKYDLTQNGFYNHTDPLDKSPFLKSIEFLNGTSISHLTEMSFQYKDDYFFLKSLNINGEVYKFDYNLRLTLPLPLVTSTDHWGYWNDSTNITNTNYTEGVYNYLTNIDSRKASNPGLADIGLLSMIEYPTGGSSLIEYECNRYKYYFKYSDLFNFEQFTSQSINYCGGARVKKIMDFDNSSQQYCNIRHYKYSTAINEQETGVLNQLPIYKTTDMFSSNYDDISYNEREFYDSLNYIRLPQWTWYRNQTSENNYIQFDLNIFNTNFEMSSNSIGANTPYPEYHISYPDVIEL